MSGSEKLEAVGALSVIIGAALKLTPRGVNSEPPIYLPATTGQ